MTLSSVLMRKSNQSNLFSFLPTSRVDCWPVTNDETSQREEKKEGRPFWQRFQPDAVVYMSRRQPQMRDSSVDGDTWPHSCHDSSPPPSWWLRNRCRRRAGYGPSVSQITREREKKKHWTPVVSDMIVINREHIRDESRRFFYQVITSALC